MSFREEVKTETSRILSLSLSLAAALAVIELFKHLFQFGYGKLLDGDLQGRLIYTFIILGVSISISSWLSYSNVNTGTNINYDHKKYR